MGDFKDWVNLTVKLRDAADSLSQYLRGQFSDETQQQLSRYDETSPPSNLLQHVLVEELNKLLQGDSLYDEQRFNQIKLTEKTRSLIEQNPQGEDLIYLNRLLLEEAYPHEIAKSPTIFCLCFKSYLEVPGFDPLYSILCLNVVM